MKWRLKIHYSLVTIPFIVAYVYGTTYHTILTGFQNGLKFNLSASNKPGNKLDFSTVSYEFNKPRASIMTGSKSGLIIQFEKNEESKDKLNFTIHLPSGKKFDVFKKTDSFECNIPGLPFTVTEKDFQGIKSARKGYPVTAYLSLQKFIRKDTSTFSAKSIWLYAFTMKFNEFRIEGNKITLNASFEGKIREEDKKMHDADYTITGEIALSDHPLGTMFTDD